MSSDWNNAMVREYRENGGRVAGQFTSDNLLLLHNVGRRTGQQHVNPTMYLRDPQDPKSVYVFATLGGSPTNPSWYYNVASAGKAQIEFPTETYDVTATELKGAERDRVYNAMARINPGFAVYEQRTAGIRTIPVFKLTRA